MSVFQIDKNGWCLQAQHFQSENCDERPENIDIDLLVLHNISLPPNEFGENWITDFFLNRLDYEAHPYFDSLRRLKVSSHFFIRRNGALIQFVSTEKRAWHAGISDFCGRERCNDFSIGVEIEGSDFQPFEPAQYKTLIKLTNALCVKHPIKHVAGHQHIAPDRKTDPGPFFDWKLFLDEISKSNVAAASKLDFPYFPKKYA